MDLKRPSFLRAATIDSIALPPTFFTAARPKRIDSPCGVKLASETLISGASTAMPISRHSLMYLTTSSVEPVTEVSSAAMNSTG